MAAKVHKKIRKTKLVTKKTERSKVFALLLSILAVFSTLLLGLLSVILVRNS